MNALADNKKNNSEFCYLNNLIKISDKELEQIYINIEQNGDNIQLLDYIDKIKLDVTKKNNLKEIQKNQIPNERKELINKFKNVIKSSKTMEQKLSLLRINPFTEFEKEPFLFFGIGGGSKALCKGLPFDVLTMILTGEKIRRNMGIKKCKILLANEITYTNINRNSEFSEESINKVMKAEKEIILLVLKKFKITQNWEVFLQSEIDSVIGTEMKKEYDKLILKADSSSMIGGHHYSIEMADIYSLVGCNSGGVKLGWYMRDIDKKNGGYIMDEQPFHARYVLFMAEQNIRNKVSLAYVNAGARLYPGPTGHLEKESPYICYNPENRLLLSPFEKPIIKLRKATLSGGGFQYKYYRKLMNGIVELFEELILGKNANGTINRIKVSTNNEFRGEGIAKKIEFILNYIFCDEKHIKKIWSDSFENIGRVKENV